MLVAITKDERPVVKDKGYEGGVVEAVAHVVDLEAAQVLCSAPLRYETPQAVITKYWDLGGGAAAKARAKKVMVELELARELHKSGAETLAKTLAALAPGWKLERPAP